MDVAHAIHGTLWITTIIHLCPRRAGNGWLCKGTVNSCGPSNIRPNTHPCVCFRQTCQTLDFAKLFAFLNPVLSDSENTGALKWSVKWSVRTLIILIDKGHVEAGIHLRKGLCLLFARLLCRACVPNLIYLVSPILHMKYWPLKEYLIQVLDV